MTLEILKKLVNEMLFKLTQHGYKYNINDIDILNLYAIPIRILTQYYYTDVKINFIIFISSLFFYLSNRMCVRFLIA